MSVVLELHTSLNSVRMIYDTQPIFAHIYKSPPLRRILSLVMASSQFPPAIPPKLPPSTETAYHGKCIDLKRRIAEIEEENEKTILRKTRHTEGLQRNRLNRAILLKWLDDMMNGGPKPTTEQLAAMQNTIQTEGTTVATDMNGMARPYHLDDETEATDEDNVPRVR